MVGQITVAMYVQVLIERERHLNDELGYVKSFHDKSINRSDKQSHLFEVG